jgi:hypothetical protein
MEKSIFLEVEVSVIEKNGSHEHASFWMVIRTVILNKCALFISFLFEGMNEEKGLPPQKSGYTRQIVCSHRGCCCLHKETQRSTQMNNMDIHIRAPKCTEVDSGLFKHLLWNIINLLFLCYKSVM